MKKKVSAFVLMAAMLLGCSFRVLAEEQVSVVFTDQNHLEYRNAKAGEDGTFLLGEAFEGVAPGETRSQSFQLFNESSKTVDFYMSTEVLQSLEEANRASGAAYDILLTAGGRELYCSAAGGYTFPEGKGSSEGLKEMNSSILKDTVPVATLAKGQTTDVVLQITFDGEAMDNSSASDYSEALARIQFCFLAGYEIPEEGNGEEQSETEEDSEYVVKAAESQATVAAKTGDASKPFAGIAAVGAGILLLMVSRERRKTEERA